MPRRHNPYAIPTKDLRKIYDGKTSELLQEKVIALVSRYMGEVDIQREGDELVIRLRV